MATNGDIAHELFLFTSESAKARAKRKREGTYNETAAWRFGTYKIQESKDLLALYVWNGEGYYKAVPNERLSEDEFFAILEVTPWIYV